MGLRLQQVLKGQWQNRSVDRSRPLKKLSLKHKLSSSKEKHKFTNSLMAVRKFCRVGPPGQSRRPRAHPPLPAGLGHYKSRAEKQRADGRLEGPACRLQAGSAPLGPDRSYGRKRLREASPDGESGRAPVAPSAGPPSDTSLCPPASPKLLLDPSGSCSAPAHVALHSPLARQLSTSSESSTPLLGASGQGGPNTPVRLFNGLGVVSEPGPPGPVCVTPACRPQQPIKRRRGESSFDINNIVIPMSVAATTRVEKLQYKEILTPR